MFCVIRKKTLCIHVYRRHKMDDFEQKWKSIYVYYAKKVVF